MVWQLIPADHQLGEASLLFQKIEDETVEKQVKKLQEAGAANLQSVQAHEAKLASANSAVEMSGLAEVQSGTQDNPVKPEIQFDDFAKIELKVGTVLACEKVEKADKLLKLTVDLGFEQRTIVSGIAMHFQPEEVVGKQVTVVTNLAPRKMRGIESQGMILMAEDANGKLVFVSPVNTVAAGSGVS